MPWVATAGVFSALIAGAAIAADWPEQEPLPWAVAAFVGFAAYLVRMPSTTDRNWTLVPGALLGVTVMGIPSWPGAALVMAGALVADVVTARVVTSRRASPASLVGSGVMFLGLAVLHQAELMPLASPPTLTWLELTGIMAVVAVWFVSESFFEAASSPSWRAARPYLLRRTLDDWPMALVMASASVTFGVLWTYSALWAVVVAVIPYSIAHHLGNRVRAARHLSDLTVRALGRLPEAAGLAASGHTRMVADLAVAMGKVAGLVGHDLSQLGVAAQLHDLGLLYSNKGEAAEQGFSSGDVASWGALILESSTSLAAAAAIVASSAEPYRLPGRDPDPSLDSRAQIIQVACRVVESVETGLTVDDAVEHLYDRSLFQFDPHIVATVRPAVGISATGLDELARPLL